MRSLLAAVSLLSIASSQTTQNILANQISSACLTNLQPSTLPDLLPAIQAAAASSNPPITNFSLAFQALVLPPLPNWLSNLSFQYQSQLSAFAATMAQIKSDAIKNHTELCSTQPSDERCGPATALTTAISLDISATIEAGGTGVVMTPVGTVSFSRLNRIESES